MTSVASLLETDNGPARRLTGKVAKLPLEIRIIINQMLDEAETYKSIVARLNELGYPGFFEQNIQRWKDHGYQRWVEFQEKRLAEKLENEEAEELAKDPKTATNLIEANEIKLARQNGRHLDAVAEWDTETTVRNSKFYFGLSRSVNQQLSERTKRERFKLEAELKRRQQEISEEGKQKIRDLTNPLTQAERKAILDAIDDILGIRIDPDEPDGARVSPPAATPESTIAPDQSSALNSTRLPKSIPSPGGEGQGEGGLSVLHSSIRAGITLDNTVEKPTESKAESCKNTVENNQPTTKNQEAPTAVPSPGGEGQGEGGLSIPDSNLAVLPTSDRQKAVVFPTPVATSDASALCTPNSALTKNTVENPTDSKAENQKNTLENQQAGARVSPPAATQECTIASDQSSASNSSIGPISIPSPACPPQLPAAAGGPQTAERSSDSGHPSSGGLGKPLGLCPSGRTEGGLHTQSSHLSHTTIQSSTHPIIQQIYRDPFPISPFATTPPSRKQPRNHIPVLDVWGQLIQWIPRDQDPRFEDPVGFENRRGHSTCWMNPKNPYALLGGEPPVHRNVPVVSWEGQILQWVPAEFEPFENAQPIRSRRFLHYKIGWWEQGPDQTSQYDSRVGAMVA